MLTFSSKAHPTQQELLISDDLMADERVPGDNDAIYDAVPKNDQIFKIEFLEIAPTPIVA